MKLSGILSDRHYQTWPSWHIIYEWENEISETLNLPISNSPLQKNNYKEHFFYKKFKGIDVRLFKGNLEKLIYETINYKEDFSLYFQMHPVFQKTFSNHRKTIPVIVDFWSKPDVELFKKIYCKCPYLLITSLEVLNFLEESNVQNRLIHFPMSLPSKYRINPGQSFEKKYDIVLAGRVNSVLWKYLKKFEEENPQIEYLYQVHKNDELYYTSSKNGLVGKVHSREDYIELIRSARISFYSTPGIDGGEIRTKGFPVTPRLLELLSAGCHIIARYPKNTDTDFYELNSICPSVSSYDQFRSLLKGALNSSPPVKKNSKYLLDHYTSNRVEVLKNI